MAAEKIVNNFRKLVLPDTITIRHSRVDVRHRWKMDAKHCTYNNARLKSVYL